MAVFSDLLRAGFCRIRPKPPFQSPVRKEFLLNITVNNCEEYILGSIALEGEMIRPVKITAFNDEYVKKTIARMKKDRLVKTAEGRIRKNNGDVVRLLDPVGPERLSDMNSDLYRHYMMTTNGHNFRPTDTRKIRYKEKASSVHFMLNEANAYIDNIKLKLKSNDFGREGSSRDNLYSALGSGLFSSEYQTFVCSSTGKTDMRTMVKNLPEEDRFFYTISAVKNSPELGGRAMSSKATGMYFSGGNSYNVYSVFDIEKLVSRKTEIEARHLLGEYHALAYGKEEMLKQAMEHPRSQAIVLINDPEFMLYILKNSPKHYFALGHLYGDYYTFPMNETGKLVIDILSEKNWEQKVKKALYSDMSGKGDGKINGKASWEFLTCDLGKARRIKSEKDILMDKYYIFCMEWQEEYLRKTFSGTHYSLIVLKDREVREFHDLVTNC